MPTFINAMNNAILRAYVTPKMGNPAAYGEFLKFYYFIILL